MEITAQEVLQFVEENDVKFVRLAFCDLFGELKNIAILAGQLERAFSSGITIEGLSVPGFEEEAPSDLLLFPDPSTLMVLPWRPNHGRVARLFCNIRTPEGEEFVMDSRRVLKRAVAKARSKGYTCQIGPECEFYLFERDENGRATQRPMDQGGYLDVAPLDKGENVRREICLMLEQMEIRPETSHHERGPGQNEIDFQYGEALAAADDLVTLKSVVDTTAERNGLAASFLPLPIPEMSGNGLHINLSLAKERENIFRTGPEHCPEAESFVAGILDHIREMTLFLNPLESSYERFGRDTAPSRVSWSRRSATQLVRIPHATGEYARMELRSPDPMCNPYLAFALLIYAGLDGIERKLPLEEPDREDGPALPANREQAARLARESDFLKEVLPQEILRQFCR